MSDPTGNDPYDRPDQSGAPGPQQPYGQQPAGQPAYGQPAYGQPYGQHGSGQAYGDPDKRPATVTAAGVITLVTAGLSLLLFVIVLVAFLVARETMTEEMRSTPGLEGINPDDVITVTIVTMVLFALWCLLAMALAVFAMRRSNGARIGLVVSAALSAVMSLIAIASLVSLLPLVASIVVIVCLFAGGASSWFSRQSGAQTSGGWQSPPVA